MDTDLQIDDIVANPSEILKDTGNTLKALLQTNAEAPTTAIVESIKEGVLVNDMTEEQFDKLLDEDFFNVHDNIKNLIEKGTGSLNALLILAQASDHPRAYEVAANFLSTLAQMNQDLISLHKKRRESQGAVNVRMGDTITNNNLYVGSPSDAVSMLRAKSANKENVQG